MIQSDLIINSLLHTFLVIVFFGEYLTRSTMKTNKQSKTGKEEWEVPHLRKIDIKETAGGAFSPNPEGATCNPS